MFFRFAGSAIWRNLTGQALSDSAALGHELGRMELVAGDRGEGESLLILQQGFGELPSVLAFDLAYAEGSGPKTVESLLTNIRLNFGGISKIIKKV